MSNAKVLHRVNGKMLTDKEYKAYVQSRLDESKQPKVSHTPTPWKLSAYDVIGLAVLSIVDAEGQEVISNTKSVKTADLIVRAVNAHEELLQIVKDLRHRSFDPTFEGWDFKRLDQAIAKAEGSQTREEK